MNSMFLQMDRPDNISLAVVLIPHNAISASLVDTMRASGEDLKMWNSKSSGVSMRFFSLYADPSADEKLLSLDGRRGTIVTALEEARRTKQPMFIVFGFSNDALHELDWRVLNREGWAVIAHPAAKTRYVGEIKNGRIPCGRGIMTHAHSSMYDRSWALGMKNGQGTLAMPIKPVTNPPTPDVIVKSGVFAKNLQTPENFIVPTSVRSQGSLIDFVEVALRNRDPLKQHVDKIARMFGWQDGDRFKLTMEWVGHHESKFPITANENVIVSQLVPRGQYPDVIESTTNLDNNRDIWGINSGLANPDD